jgi:hypothetical protein
LEKPKNAITQILRSHCYPPQRPSSLHTHTSSRRFRPVQTRRLPLLSNVSVDEIPIRKEIDLSTVFAGQAVGIKEVEEGIWLVSFMEYDLGYIDLEEKTLLNNLFGPKV